PPTLWSAGGIAVLPWLPWTSAGGGWGAIAISPDGELLAEAAGEQGIRLWDTATRQRLPSASSPRAREARLLGFSSDGTLASVGRDREILLWDRKAEHVRQTLTSDRERITSLAFSPDGGTLASGGSDGAVVLWDVETGRSLRTLVGHQGEVTCVA